MTTGWPTRWLAWAWVIVLLTGPGTARGQQPTKPEDFAYGFSLEARMGAPFQEVVLPADFYRSVTRPDLQDSAVFDAERKPVPHAFRVPGQPSAARVTEWLPIFPLSAHQERGSGGLSLTLRRAPDGTLLDLKADSDIKTGAKTAAYIMDASFLNDPYSALELDFQRGGESQLFRVSIEGSNDLSRWAMVKSLQTIGRLAHEGRSLEKGKVEFSPCRYKYLRLTWESEGEPLRLHEARVAFSVSMIEDLHEWEMLTGELVQKDQGYLFDTRGLMPVERLKVVFPGTNVAVPVKIYSRTNVAEAWRFRSEALVHRLSIEGKVYSAEEIRLTTITHDRYWKVEAKMPEEALNGAGAVELHVGWVPRRLVFLAQGTGPYVLAFGSSSRQVPPFPLQSLMDRVPPEARSKLLVGSAAMSGMHALGGEQALRPVEPPLPWKRWILWTVLVAGVALMGWMAFKLKRQLGKGSD
jgi:hypothetical protein